MRLVKAFFFISLLVAVASATELRVKVIDPQAAAVSGAEVILLQDQRPTPVDIKTTSAGGIVVFEDVSEGKYHIRILAPGFASEDRAASAVESPLTVKLHLATAAETVVVTATRSPAPEEEAGASVSTLEGNQLDVMRPVAAADAMRFLPGAVVNVQGQRGGLGSLFVRGGDSRYNKVIVDGVTINDPGGTFDFGVVPLQETERVEFVRGAQSTLYGSDAMTSVLQTWTREGSTPVPELRLGADGGTFNTADGYLSLAGARSRYDYDFFGAQFYTNGQGPNDSYSNSSQGGNVGVQLGPRALFRVRARHSNSRTGVPGEWDFNNSPLLPPDSDQFARQNNLLVSAELSLNEPSRWQHRLRAFEYHHKRANVDTFADPGRGAIDFPLDTIFNLNRAGFAYEGDYVERSWARTTFGYEFEDENGFTGDLNFPPIIHGLRLNHAAYAQQAVTWGRLSIIAGARFVHNTTFGNKGVPRIALALQALKGDEVFSGTRLRFSYATGIKEARFEEAFARGQGIIPNPNLKAEENRAFEAGLEQGLFGGKYSLSATYYNNLFRNQIDFAIIDFQTFTGQYENIDRSMAHGAEVELHGRPLSRLSMDVAYNYTSTQILQQPFAFDPLHKPGQPLLRRPKHSGSVRLNYLASRWGANLGGSFVGPRPDSDFLGFNIDHAAGYALVNLGGWYALTSRITAYVNVENALNRHYNEVVGYPGLTANFRAGMRFRIGGK